MTAARDDAREVLTLLAPGTAGATIGRLVACAPDGQPEVEVPGRGVQRARVLRSVDRRWLASAAAVGSEVLLVFVGGDPAQPVVVGLLEDPVEALLHGAADAAAAEERAQIDVAVDGRSVVLEATHSVALRCGEASVTLYADGTIETRGVNIVSQASEQQRLQGAVVKIN